MKTTLLPSCSFGHVVSLWNRGCLPSWDYSYRQRPQEGAGSLGARVTGGFEPSSGTSPYHPQHLVPLVSGNRLSVSARGVCQF